MAGESEAVGTREQRMLAVFGAIVATQVAQRERLGLDPPDLDRMRSFVYEAWAVAELAEEAHEALVADGELVVAPGKTFEVPRDIARMATIMHTQDNRATSFPMYVVRDRYDQDSQYEWETVCFTQEAAAKYIEQHRHNLCDPHVYVASGYRNAEWQRMRAFLMGLVPRPPGSRDCDR